MSQMEKENAKPSDSTLLIVENNIYEDFEVEENLNEQEERYLESQRKYTLVLEEYGNYEKDQIQTEIEKQNLISTEKHNDSTFYFRSKFHKSKSCKENDICKLNQNLKKKSNLGYTVDSSYSESNSTTTRKNIINENFLFDPKFSKYFSKSAANKTLKEEKMLKNLRGKLSLLNLRSILNYEEKAQKKTSEGNFQNINNEKQENKITHLNRQKYYNILPQNPSTFNKIQNNSEKLHNNIKIYKNENLINNQEKNISNLNIGENLNFVQHNEKTNIEQIDKYDYIYGSNMSIGRWTESPINDNYGMYDKVYLKLKNESENEEFLEKMEFLKKEKLSQNLIEDAVTNFNTKNYTNNDYSVLFNKNLEADEYESIRKKKKSSLNIFSCFCK